MITIGIVELIRVSWYEFPNELGKCESTRPQVMTFPVSWVVQVCLFFTISTLTIATGLLPRGRFSVPSMTLFRPLSCQLPFPVPFVSFKSSIRFFLLRPLYVILFTHPSKTVFSIPFPPTTYPSHSAFRFWIVCFFIFPLVFTHISKTFNCSLSFFVNVCISDTYRSTLQIKTANHTFP